MEEKMYVGYAYGTFTGDDGQQRAYANVYMLSPFAGEESDTRHYGGQMADKYRCVSPDVFADVQPNTRVMCYFDSKGKLAFMQPVNGPKSHGGPDAGKA